MPKPAIVRYDTRDKLEPWPDFPETEISSGDRGSCGHLWHDNPALGLKVGVWEAKANLGRWMNWPVHEFMIVLEGEVVMVEEDRETVVSAGESFFIPKGRRCIWNQAGYFKKIMMLFDDPAGDSAKPIMKIDPKVNLQPSTPPSSEILHSPVPAQHAHEYFENKTGEFTVGVWDTTGYHRKLIDFPRYELMHLLEGSVTLANDVGGSKTFNAGDTFFVPFGAPNSWKSEGYLRKIYCIFQPK